MSPGAGVSCSPLAMLPQLLEGVGAHLDSTTPALRAIGQVVAEGVVTKLDEHGNQLRFEVDTVCYTCLLYMHILR